MDIIQPILYSFRRCPYAMRARMALAYADIDYQHREILLNDKPQSMLSYSTKGTVPVLIVSNKVVDESLEVMYWALEQSDTAGWLSNGLNNDKQGELIEQCDDTFKTQLDCYKYSDRYALTQVEYRQQALWFLQILEKKLNKNQFLFGNKISLADIAIFPFIRQFAFVNKQWFDDTDYHSLQTWLDFHLNSKLFQSIMVKHSLWCDV